MKGAVFQYCHSTMLLGVLFAIETALRRGELLAMAKKDIYDGYVHLPKTKNGDSRNVPLSEEAKELLKLIQHTGRNIIPQSENAFRLMWEKEKRVLVLITFIFMIPVMKLLHVWLELESYLLRY